MVYVRDDVSLATSIRVVGVCWVSVHVTPSIALARAPPTAALVCACSHLKRCACG